LHVGLLHRDGVISEVAPDHDVPRCAAAKQPYQLLNVVDLTSLKAMSELRYKINEYLRHIPVASVNSGNPATD
jgi:hypothetical protein